MRKTDDKKAGRKTSKYQKEEVINEISAANPTRIKKENPYSVKNKLKMAIKSVSERNRFKAGAIKESNIEEGVYIIGSRDLSPRTVKVDGLTLSQVELVQVMSQVRVLLSVYHHQNVQV